MSAEQQVMADSVEARTPCVAVLSKNQFSGFSMLSTRRGWVETLDTCGIVIPHTLGLNEGLGAAVGYVLYCIVFKKPIRLRD